MLNCKAPIAVALSASILTLMTAVVAGQDRKTIWDGVYTDEQAERGKTAFESSCTTCHNADLSGGNGPALAGDTFTKRWDTRSLARLFTEMKSRMPRNDPGSLPDATYVDIVSYILQANNFPAGGEALIANADLLGSILIVKKDEQPAELPTGTLVHVVGCLQGSDNAWLLTNTSTPVRTENPNASKENELKKIEAMPLGPRSFRLMGVYDSLDPHKGHRMEGKGFLIRDPDGDRINIVLLEMLSSSCAP